MNQQILSKANIEQTSYLGRIPLLSIKTERFSAQISLFGGQLISWQPKRGAEVLWCTPLEKVPPGKAIRGGAPICWPWFGKGDDPKAPAHGFARIARWQLHTIEDLDNSRVKVTLDLHSSNENQAWTTDLRLRCIYILGEELQVDLQTTNIRQQVLHYTEALHTYFYVGDIEQVSVSGLEGCVYLDKLEDYQRKRQQGPLSIDQATDKIFLDSPSECVLIDPSMKRKIHIEKQGSRNTIVWNPGAEQAKQLVDMHEQSYRNMLCLESGNVAPQTVNMPPNSTHTLKTRYRIETL